LIGIFVPYGYLVLDVNTKTRLLAFRTKIGIRRNVLTLTNIYFLI